MMKVSPSESSSAVSELNIVQLVNLDPSLNKKLQIVSEITGGCAKSNFQRHAGHTISAVAKIEDYPMAEQSTLGSGTKWRVALHNLGKLLLVLAAALVTTACDEQPSNRVVWTPDARTMAVIAGDGLHLGYTDGSLSPMLAADIEQLEWMPDSKHAVLVKSTQIGSWEKLKQLLSAKEVAQISHESAVLEQAIRSCHADFDKLSSNEQVNKLTEPQEAVLYLLAHCNRSLTDICGTHWRELQAVTVNSWQVEVAAVNWTSLLEETVLLKTTQKVDGIRLSPDGQKVVIVQSPKSASDGCHRLSLTPTASTSLRLLSESASRFPDWSPDSQSVIFIQKNNNPLGHLQLASLLSITVSDEHGNLTTGPYAPVCLVDLPFQQNARVRCQKDGRIFFSSADLLLPCTATDLPARLSLFALDPGRQVVPLLPRQFKDDSGSLPEYFEVSQDGSKIAIPGSCGSTALLTIADRSIQTVQPDATYKKLLVIPSFRSANELCLVAPCAKDNKDETPSQLLLWSIHERSAKPISAAWPPSALKNFLQS